MDAIGMTGDAYHSASRGSGADADRGRGA
jgi:hypothetical protein